MNPRVPILRSSLHGLAALGLFALAACQETGTVLDLRTSPPGARIEVNGRHQGDSPIKLKLDPGEHLVVANREGFLETRATARVGSEGATRLDLPLRPLYGLVLVESFPTEADVLLDGSFRGKTPVLMTDVTGGNHKLSVKKDGYETRLTDLTIDNRQPRLVALELRSLLTAIKVTSVPDKARVLIDGSFVGESPLSKQDILAGKHKVRIEMDGYEPYEQEVEVAGKEEYHVNALLQEKYASIKLDTDPLGGEVFLNNEPRGKAPVLLDKLHDGDYTIKVTKRGFPDVERKVTLKKGEALELKIPFEKLLGIIQVITIPPGVDVFVDGEKMGTTVGLPNIPYSTPLFIRDVPQGQRVVKFVKAGFTDVSMLAPVKADQTTTLSNVQLKRLFIPDTEIVTKEGRTLRGLINRTEADGTIHFETAPGIFMDIPADQISGKKPIAK